MTGQPNTAMITTPSVNTGRARPTLPRGRRTPSTLGVQALLWGYPMVCYAQAEPTREGAPRMLCVLFLSHPEAEDGADRTSSRRNSTSTYRCRRRFFTCARSRWSYTCQRSPRHAGTSSNSATRSTKLPPTSAGSTDRVLVWTLSRGPRFDGKLPGEITVIHLRTTQCVCTMRVFVDGGSRPPVCGCGAGRVPSDAAVGLPARRARLPLARGASAAGARRRGAAGVAALWPYRPGDALVPADLRRHRRRAGDVVSPHRPQRRPRVHTMDRCARTPPRGSRALP